MFDFRTLLLELFCLILRNNHNLDFNGVLVFKLNEQNQKN